MNTEAELPADVLEAIHAGRKIDAIKRLRAQNGLGLKEAKELVDAYVQQHPDLVVQRGSSSSLRSGPVLCPVCSRALMVPLGQSPLTIRRLPLLQSLPLKILCRRRC